MTKATKYIRNIKKVDYVRAKQYLERNGWTVVRYNTPKGNVIVDKLGLREYVNRTDGFVYEMNCLKYVFINGQLSDKDKLITLLHETGHIELEQDLSLPDKTDEVNAWHFVYEVLYFKTNTFKKIISFVLTAALTALAIFTCHSLLCKVETLNQNVYVTHSGKRYHTEDCYFVRNKDTLSMELKEAQKQYKPCVFCNPNK